MNCVNISHPDFKKLLVETGKESFELEMEVANWQEVNNSDKFPESKDLTKGDVLFQLNKKGIASPEEKKLYNILRKFNIGESGFLGSMTNRVEVEEALEDADIKATVEKASSGSYFVRHYGQPFKPGSYTNLQQVAPKKQLMERAKELDEAMKVFLEVNGINYKSVNKIYYDGELVDARAKADILTGTVEVIEGKKLIDTLPEETAHMYIELVGGENNPAVKKMMEDVVQTSFYNDVVNEYGIIYNYDPVKMQKEAIGKLIAKHIIEDKKGLGTDALVETWWNSLWSMIVKFFGKNPETDYYKHAAYNIMKSAKDRVPVKSKFGYTSTIGTKKESLLQVVKPDYTQENLEQSKGQMDEMFYEFEKYFPEYSYLNDEQRSNFLSLMSEGKIQITCKL